MRLRAGMGDMLIREEGSMQQVISGYNEIETHNSKQEDGKAADNYIIQIIRKPDVTDLAGEKVMIDFDNGKYFMLTGSASDIWDMLDEGVESESIVAGLLDLYDVEYDECKEGVLSFLHELKKIGYITLQPCN
jgi:hypothetical protein